MPQISSYQALITSEHQGQPKFMATIAAVLGPIVQIQNIITSLNILFDLNSASGSQLDIIGQWVGVSRNIAIPIPGVVFTWDGTKAEGWDYGTWNGVTGSSVITILPDDAYKTLIRARIASNSWDGTIPSAYNIFEILFPNYTILIQDYGNMTMLTAIVGIIPDSLTIALLTGGYIALRPEGVLNNYAIPIDTNPLFAWDTETAYLQGWDQGSWANVVT